MGTIRVNDDVKERLRDKKREGESFNDLLDRLSRDKTDIEEKAGALSDVVDSDFDDKVEEAHEELNESLEERFEE